MPEPRKAKATVSVGNQRGKSQRDLEVQMNRISDALYNQYRVRERFTTSDGRRGVREYTSQRGGELYRRAQAAYLNYSRNINLAVNPEVTENNPAFGWLTEEERNRRVPRSVYMRNNRR